MTKPPQWPWRKRFCRVCRKTKSLSMEKSCRDPNPTSNGHTNIACPMKCRALRPNWYFLSKRTGAIILPSRPLGCFMVRLRGAFFLCFLLMSSAMLPAQTGQPAPVSPSQGQNSPQDQNQDQTQDKSDQSQPTNPPAENAPEPGKNQPAPDHPRLSRTPTVFNEPAPGKSSSDIAPATVPKAAPISPDAPRMTRQTRFEIIRDFETQIFYARTVFPMGTKGIQLKDGVTTPSGPELQQALALWGPAVKPGDPAQISYVQIRDNHIHFDINGGPVHRKKWYQRVEITGANGNPVQTGPTEAQTNPHGTYLDVYFDKYVPEMSVQQLRDLLFPVLDFTARNKEEAYLDTVPPKVKEAIQAHYVLVGMNTEMVLHAKGKPPKKVRERDNGVDYEEWIYGEAPQDVDFVRIVNDEVVRVETMKVGGQKILRTEKEIILDHPDKEAEAKKEEEDRPANAPSLRRPGEDPDNVPKPAEGPAPPPIMPPPDIPQPQGTGPNLVVPAK
jgi:hypothetical protein